MGNANLATRQFIMTFFMVTCYSAFQVVIYLSDNNGRAIFTIGTRIRVRQVVWGLDHEPRTQPIGYFIVQSFW